MQNEVPYSGLTVLSALVLHDLHSVISQTLHFVVAAADFQVHASKPFICRECGHCFVYHTIVADDDKPDNTKNDSSAFNGDPQGSILSIIARGLQR